MKLNTVCLFCTRHSRRKSFVFRENFLLLLLADEKLKNIYVVSSFEYFIVFFFILMMQKPLREQEEWRRRKKIQNSIKLWDAHVKLKQINIKYDYQIVFFNLFCASSYEEIMWHTFTILFTYIRQHVYLQHISR